MGDISNEPSMEDILSSIKQIIKKDEETVRARGPRFSAPRQPVADPDEILELTEAVPADPAPAAGLSASDEAELVSHVTAEASRNALASLSALVVKPEQADNTLEGLVRDMLRPMLKQWLDANLPHIVEAMVQREIARITGKAL